MSYAFVEEMNEGVSGTSDCKEGVAWFLHLFACCFNRQDLVIDQTDFKLILLPQPAKCWDYR